MADQQPGSDRTVQVVVLQLRERNLKKKYYYFISEYLMVVFSADSHPVIQLKFIGLFPTPEERFEQRDEVLGMLRDRTLNLKLGDMTGGRIHDSRASHGHKPLIVQIAENT